jgi:predicted dithiol-disulfide oxidoreductase (DUF899 family)
MGKFHQKQFPGESGAYRHARDELLSAEIALRKHVEEVAALRRTLPLGGKLKEDYVFDEGAADLSNQQTVKQTRFSELFEKGKNSLIVYSFMYAPEAENACPMCTSLLDGLNGNAVHARQRVNFVVVAKAPIQKIRSWAFKRDWKNLRLLSSFRNTYNTDYFTETPEGSQLPALNVFQKTADGIYHFYNTELLYAPSEKGQNPRHVDMIWPLWNLFDLTPEGRGTNWFPKFAYD